MLKDITISFSLVTSFLKNPDPHLGQYNFFKYILENYENDLSSKEIKDIIQAFPRLISVVKKKTTELQLTAIKYTKYDDIVKHLDFSDDKIIEPAIQRFGRNAIRRIPKLTDDIIDRIYLMNPGYILQIPIKNYTPYIENKVCEYINDIKVYYSYSLLDGYGMSSYLDDYGPEIPDKILLTMVSHKQLSLGNLAAIFYGCYGKYKDREVFKKILGAGVERFKTFFNYVDTSSMSINLLKYLIKVELEVHGLTMSATTANKIARLLRANNITLDDPEYATVSDEVKCFIVLKYGII